MIIEDLPGNVLNSRNRTGISTWNANLARAGFPVIRANRDFHTKEIQVV
jgi:hypothetical protein